MSYALAAIFSDSSQAFFELSFSHQFHQIFLSSPNGRIGQSFLK